MAPRKRKQAVSSRTQGGVNDQTFDLIMARFDTLEHQNQTQLDLLEKHVEKDDAVHKVVERHAAYWKLFLVGIPLAGSALGKKMGWI
jgi:hypothetical protein